MLKNGARWAVSNGYGTKEDLEHIEEKGCIPGADPELVSNRAIERGLAQLGTLGSGNHFVEVGYVSEIYNEEIARALGLEKDGITIVVHTGSRGLGYQVCDDFIRVMIDASRKYNIELPDRQLCCAPINSPEGKEYLAAMACAANYAFANRQMITHWVRESFERALHVGPKESRISPCMMSVTISPNSRTISSMVKRSGYVFIAKAQPVHFRRTTLIHPTHINQLANLY